MQDMGQSLQHKELGTIRHRTVFKTDTNTSKSSQEDDPWLNIPHDIESSKLPLESRSLNPTAVYWVSPHGILTKKITVLDLTDRKSVV